MSNQLPDRPKLNFISFKDFVLTLDSVAGQFDKPVQMQGYCKIGFRHQGADDVLVADFKELPPENGDRDVMAGFENSWEDWKRAQAGHDLQTEKEKLEVVVESLIAKATERVKERE